MIRFCTLFSSSSGNSAFISDGDTNLLIDAGVSASKILNSLKEIGIGADEIDGILVTHEHSDHIAGIGVLARRYNIPVYANEPTMTAITNFFGNFPDDCIRIIKTGESFAIRSAVVRSFKTPHDSAESVGYTVDMCNKKYSVATDTGCITKSMLASLARSEAVLIEANHDVDMLKNGKYPYVLKKRILSDNGHLSNDNCAWLATQLVLWGTGKIILGHLSENNNTPVKAYETVINKLNESSIKAGSDVLLAVAEKNKICEI